MSIAFYIYYYFIKIKKINKKTPFTNYCQHAKDLVVKLAPLHAQSVLRSKEENVGITELTTYCNYLLKTYCQRNLEVVIFRVSIADRLNKGSKLKLKYILLVEFFFLFKYNFGESVTLFIFIYIYIYTHTHIHTVV